MIFCTDGALVIAVVFLAIRLSCTTCVYPFTAELSPRANSCSSHLAREQIPKSVCTRSEYCYRISEQQLKRINMAGHDSHLVGRGFETGFIIVIMKQVLGGPLVAANVHVSSLSLVHVVSSS